MQISVWNARKHICRKPVDLHPYDVLQAWLFEHDPEEKDDWDLNRIAPSRMFYRPYHNPASKGEIQPPMNENHRQKHGLETTGEYYRRLAMYQELASNVI